MSQQNVEFIRGLYAAFAKGDVPGVMDAMAPDIDWREAEGSIFAGGNPYIGANAILNGVLIKLAGARTLLTVPMLMDNEVVGAITIYRKDVQPFVGAGVRYDDV